MFLLNEQLRIKDICTSFGVHLQGVLCKTLYSSRVGTEMDRQVMNGALLDQEIRNETDFDADRNPENSGRSNTFLLSLAVRFPGNKSDGQSGKTARSKWLESLPYPVRSPPARGPQLFKIPIA